MPVGTVTVSGVGHMPVLVAVGGVAVLAESCIVIEPGCVVIFRQRDRSLNSKEVDCATSGW